MEDKRGHWRAECARIKHCTSCRLYHICKGDRKFLRTLSLGSSDYRNIYRIANKPLDKGKRLSKYDTSGVVNEGVVLTLHKN